MSNVLLLCIKSVKVGHKPKNVDHRLELLIEAL